MFEQRIEDLSKYTDIEFNEKDIVNFIKLAEGILKKEMEKVYNSCEKIIKKNIVKKYGREFLVYGEEKDIYGNAVSKKELYSGSKKRYVYYVEKIQK